MINPQPPSDVMTKEELVIDDPEVIARWGKTIEERMAIMSYVKELKKLIMPLATHEKIVEGYKDDLIEITNGWISTCTKIREEKDKQITDLKEAIANAKEEINKDLDFEWGLENILNIANHLRNRFEKAKQILEKI